MGDGVWTVESDEPRSVTTQAGIASGRRITYLTGNGVTGYIDVAMSDYTPAKIKSLIGAAVAAHDEIGKGSVQLEGA